MAGLAVRAQASPPRSFATLRMTTGRGLTEAGPGPLSPVPAGTSLASVGFQSLAIVLLTLLLATPLAALDPDRLPSQYVLAGWRDELPQSIVRTLLQDRQGYLWLGTQNGLARFDGKTFRVFDPGNTPELGSGDVRALHEDAAGRLWVGTRGGGLARWDGQRFERIAAAPEGGASPTLVYALAADARGALLVGTRGQGALALEGERLAPPPGAEGLATANVLSLLTGPDGSVWIGLQNGGLHRLHGHQRVPVAPDLLGEQSVLALLRDRSGQVWAGTRSAGLWRLAGGDPARAEPLPGLEGTPITALAEDRDGNLWVGTYGAGLARLHAGRLDRLDRTGGLADEKVLALLEDREANLWVGTEGGGLQRLRDGAFRTFGAPEGLAAPQVWAVLEDRRGTVWLGTDGGGLARLDAGGFRHFGSREGLGGDSITSLFEDSRGDLWIGVRGVGLLRRSGERFERFGPEQGLAAGTVLALAEDDAGALWLGTSGQGLYRRQADGGFEPFAPEAELADDRVWALARGFDGELYAGTDGEGLKVIRGGKVERLGPDQGLPSATVSAIHTDEDGIVWLGTYGGGLARLVDGRITVATRRHGLPEDAILQVLDDELGWLWLSSNRGVARIAKQDLAAVLDGRQERLLAEVFGKADGMRSAECNGAFQPAGFRARDGRLWFPTIEGAVVVDPARLPQNPVPPGIVLESALADGESLLARERPILPAGTERFELSWAGLSFAEPERVRYRHQLEGFDHAWVDAGAERRATYTNLPTGRSYRFVVQAANEDGVWSPEGAALAFTVRPHLWQQPAFVLLVSVAAALLAWGAYQVRVRQLLRRTRQLEGLVAERTAEVVAQRDQLSVANEELTRLNQFKSEFMGIAAHDLKNPLAVVYGYAGLMIDKSREDPGQTKIARRIGASARRMLSIVSDLLDSTAIESGKIPFEPEPIDAGEILEGVVETQRMLAQDRGVELVCRVDGETRAVVDRERFRRIAENLIGNAIRYTRPATGVTVTLTERQEDGERRLRLAVQDHGPGIAQADIPRLFHRFEKLAEGQPTPAGSTGLGLSIVQRFVDLHGGRVWVESEVGVGSTFYVELPPTPAAPPACTPPP